MTPKYKERDKIKTIRARKLSKKSKLYKNSIQSILDKTYRDFEVKRFYDVEGGKYRFHCKCLKCGKDVYLHGTKLKWDKARCKYCHVPNYSQKRRISRTPYGRRGPYKKNTIEVVKIKESCSIYKILAVVFVYSTLKDITTFILGLYGLI